MAFGAGWVVTKLFLGNPQRTIKQIEKYPESADYYAGRFFEENADNGRTNVNKEHGGDIIEAMTEAARKSGDSNVGGEIFKTALDLNETYLKDVTGQDGQNRLIEKMGDYAGGFPKDSLDRESVRGQFNEFVANKTDEEQKGFRDVFENAMAGGTSIGDAPRSRNRGAQPGADDAGDPENDRNRPWPPVAQPVDEEVSEGKNSLWRKNLAEMLVDPSKEFAYETTFALNCGEQLGGIRFTKNGPTHLTGAAATDINALEIAVLRHAERSGGISVTDSTGKHTDFAMMAAAIAEWHHAHDNVIPGEVKHRYKPNKQNEGRYDIIKQRVNAHLNEKYGHKVADYGQDAAADGGAEPQQSPPPPPPAPPSNNGPDGNSGPPSGDGPKDGGNPPPRLGGGGGGSPTLPQGGGGLPPAGGSEGSILSDADLKLVRAQYPDTTIMADAHTVPADGPKAVTVSAQSTPSRSRSAGRYAAMIAQKAKNALETPTGKEAVAVAGAVIDRALRSQLSKMGNPAVATLPESLQSKKEINKIDVAATAVEDNAGTTQAANNIVRTNQRLAAKLTPSGR